jgi:molecular chaperone GrpE
MRKKKIVIPTEEEVAEYASDAERPEPPAPKGESDAEATPAAPPPEPDEAGQWREKFLRAKAELSNYQKRAEKERVDALRYAHASLVRAILPVLADLERVIESGEAHKDSPDAILDGARLTLDNLLKVLREYHVERIESVGQPFDPAVHEAMMERPSADHPDRTVLQEVAKGYRLYDRVLSPAKVIVSKAVGPEGEAEAPESAGGEEAKPDKG